MSNNANLLSNWPLVKVQGHDRLSKLLERVNIEKYRIGVRNAGNIIIAARETLMACGMNEVDAIKLIWVHLPTSDDDGIQPAIHEKIIEEMKLFFQDTLTHVAGQFYKEEIDKVQLLLTEAKIVYLMEEFETFYNIRIDKRDLASVKELFQKLE